RVASQHARVAGLYVRFDRRYDARLSPRTDQVRELQVAEVGIFPKIRARDIATKEQHIHLSADAVPGGIKTLVVSGTVDGVVEANVLIGGLLLVQWLGRIFPTKLVQDGVQSREVSLSA